MTPHCEKYPTAALVAYYLTLTAFFVASFYPQYRVWGINWWAYFPLWVKFGLLAIGAVAPLAADRLIDKLLAGRDDITPKTYRWLVGGFAVTMAALFYLLRARTHFLGDGYQLLSMLGSENLFIKPRNLGGTIFQYWIMKIMGGRGEADALLAYQVVSYTAGALFLIMVIWSAAKLCTNRLSRFLFVVTLSTGGYALLFFGYVENYSLFVVSVAAFGLAGVLILARKLSRWWVIPIFATSVFLHVFGVALAPACVFVLLYNTSLQKRVDRWAVMAKVCLGSLMLGTSVGVFIYFYMTSLFFQLAILPFAKNMFTVEGYTLFSMKHLLDSVSLLLVFFPGILVSLVVLVRSKPDFTSAKSRFLIVYFASCLGVAFIFAPALGMPRDWDLFAMAGIALSIWLTSLTLGLRNSESEPRRTLLLVAVLASMLLVPRAIVQTDTKQSMALAKNYIHLDKSKSGPARFLLIKFLEGRGDSASVIQLKTEWGDDLLPDEAEVSAGKLLDQGKLDEALPLLRQLLEVRPNTPTAWENLGRYFHMTNQPDSALYYLNISQAMSPYNKNVLYDIGFVNYTMRRLEIAQEYFLGATQIDSLYAPALVGLAQTYQERQLNRQYLQFLEKITNRPQAPAQLWQKLIEYYLSTGAIADARITVERSRGRGLSDEQIRVLIETHPQLRMKN